MLASVYCGGQRSREPRGHRLAHAFGVEALPAPDHRTVLCLECVAHIRSPREKKRLRLTKLGSSVVPIIHFQLQGVVLGEARPC